MEEKNIIFKKEFYPKVSIIIPVYNGANYMREAIDSALNQTYKNIEVVVVNDGSTDDTEKIAKSYEDRIRYFYKENGGVATALNLAIEKADGEYISWLSHDDVYYLDKIEKQIIELSEIDEKDRLRTILMSNYSLINEESKITHIQKFHEVHDFKKLNYSLYPLLKGLVHGCTLLIPKRCFESVGFFDSALRATQDYDLWFRMFQKYKMLFMSDLLVKSRWHSEQGSKKITTANKEADELWIKMVKNMTDEQKVAIDDSVLSFYQKTYNIVKSAGYAGAEKYLFKIIEDCKKRDISKIKVSVIIPFFNRIDWTIGAIESVTAQTHENLEAIVVDDFSTENVSPIKKLVENDNRIKFVQNRRKKGVSGARNTGIDFSTGEYIAFLDSDDLFLPEKIEKQLEFMVRNGFLLSHTSYELFSAVDNELRIIESGKDYEFPNIISSCGIATPAVMIHRDMFYNKNNRFIEKFLIGEDTCFWIKLSKIACFHGMNVVLTKVREHGNNAAYDKEKQIEGLNNILSYSIKNFLNKKTSKDIKLLSMSLVEAINNCYGDKELTLQNKNNDKFLEKNISNISLIAIVKHKLFLLFLKYKDIFPQSIRTAVRINLVKLYNKFKSIK